MTRSWSARMLSTWWILGFFGATVLVALGLLFMFTRTSRGGSPGENKAPESLVAGNIAARVPHANLAEQLDVFDQARQPADELPPGIHKVLERLANAVNAGSVKPESSRVTLEGSEGLRLFVVATTKGWVCYATEDARTGSCAQVFNEGVAWQLQFYRSGEIGVLLVIGIQENEVRSVAVRGTGGEFPATVGQNTFYWRAEGKNLSLDAAHELVIRYVDGRVRRVPLLQG